MEEEIVVPIRCRLAVAGGFGRRPYAAQRLGEARRIDGLQQVVDGVNLECLHCIGIVRGHEHRAKRPRVPCEQVEPGFSAQLDIEKHDVRALLSDDGFGFVDASRLSDDDDVALAGEQRLQRSPRETLVVDDDGA